MDRSLARFVLHIRDGENHKMTDRSFLMLIGDNWSTWEYMKASIAGILQFQVYGIPMVRWILRVYGVGQAYFGR
jgi:hypothetical protein